MILVVDSGSYKSDWMFQPEGEDVLLFRAKGVNPYFSSEKEIVKVIQHIQEIKPYIIQVTEIYYFGSGCTNPDRREIISNALSTVFPAAFICIDNDVIGSAYATCGNEEGLIATLGTGSSISFFTGEEVLPSRQGLGFVLGDIGSGAWFGKRLVRSFLYESMPDDLAIHFGEKYNISKKDVLENVYKRKTPNVYLASFAPFLSEYKNHPYISALINRGLVRYMEMNVCLYPDYKDHICHFVGSIAYHFEREIRIICQKYEIQVGKIIQQPIQDLYYYILKREKINSTL